MYVRASWSLSTSDSTPAGFMILNLANTYELNRVAGSESYGFWLDMLENVEGEIAGTVCPTCKVPIKFESNGAHSNARHGLYLTH